MTMRFAETLKAAATLADEITGHAESRVIVGVFVNPQGIVIRASQGTNVIQQVVSFETVERAEINVLTHTIRDLAVRLDPVSEFWITRIKG